MFCEIASTRVSNFELPSSYSPNETTAAQCPLILSSVRDDLINFGLAVPLIGSTAISRKKRQALFDRYRYLSGCGCAAMFQGLKERVFHITLFVASFIPRGFAGHESLSD